MSERQDFSDIGERIRSAIQDAVETGDFGQINDIVNDTVGGAMDEVRRQVNQAHDRINRSYSDRSYREPDRKEDAANRDYASRYRSRSVHYQRRTMYSSGKKDEQSAVGDSRELPYENAELQGSDRAQGSAAHSPAAAQRELPGRYFEKKGMVAGILYTVFGGIGLGVFGLTALGLLIVFMVNHDPKAAGLTVLFGLLTGGFSVMLGKGCGLQGRLMRAKRYMKLAGERMYLRIEDLAAHTGQSARRVHKDVRNMLNAGIFPEGHLDEKEKVLVLSDESWKQYSAAQQEYESRRRLEEQEKEEQERMAEEGMDMTAEQQIEKEGRAYMERLRQLNVEIPGEVISNKLYQLDYLLQRIFMVLKEHPEKCPQMRKFMDYYLPTTVKLVESYADFDKAGIQGDNIMTAKAEIEKTMDTINQAFEKLLDDMYQDAAFEAAADAKVLKTVLAQDGYMKSEFTMNQEKEGE